MALSGTVPNKLGEEPEYAGVGKKAALKEKLLQGEIIFCMNGHPSTKFCLFW